MKVALVVPQTSISLGANLPLNLGYIGSYLKQEEPNIEVRIIDGSVGENVEEELFLFQPNIVGVTATTPQVLSAYKLADTLKLNRPDIQTVIGGAHASALPEEASQHFDVTVVGDGEKAFVNIVQQFMKQYSTTKIIYGEPIENLDDIPLDFSLFNMAAYLKVDYSFLGMKGLGAMLITSRGCPYRCRFCYNSGRSSKVRYHSSKRIMEMVNTLHKNYGVTNVLFEDDEFLINKARLIELKTLMTDTPWFHWACSARANTLNVWLLSLIKSMNCVMVIVGFESGVEKTLRYLKDENTKLSDSYKAIEYAETVKMPLGGYFIIGAPFETELEMELTKNFIEKSHLVFVNVNALVPYPGSRLWQDCKELKLVSEGMNYNLLNNNIGEPSFTVTQVSKRRFNRLLFESRKIAAVQKTGSVKKFITKSIRKDFRYMWLHQPKVMIRELWRLLS